MKATRNLEQTIAFRVPKELLEAIQAYGRSLGILNMDGSVNMSSTVCLLVMESLRDTTGFTQLQNALVIARSERLNLLLTRLRELYSQMVREMR